MSCKQSLSRRQALQGLGALVASASSASTFAQSEKPIVLGQSAAITGPAAQLGLQMNQGARLVFDAVNAAGGINGRPIELRLVDDGYEPERCKANTEKFIRDEVFALFGYVGTPTALAALPAVTAAQMPFIAPFTGAQALRDPFHRSVFHVRASYFDETALIVKQLANLHLHSIAVFRQNDSYGQAGLDGVQRAMAANDGTPVAVGLVERNSVDVAAAVRAILPKKPEAIVMISAYKSSAAFIRAARAAGYGGLFYNVSFVGTQALMDELGKDARGVQVSQVMPSPFSTTNGASRAYLEAIRQAGGKHQPNYSGMEGFVAARVMVDGLRRSASGPKPPSRDALLAALEATHLDFGGFAVNFGPRQHVGSQFVELTLLTEDGKVRR